MAWLILILNLNSKQLGQIFFSILLVCLIYSVTQLLAIAHSQTVVLCSEKTAMLIPVKMLCTCKGTATRWNNSWMCLSKNMFEPRLSSSKNCIWKYLAAFDRQVLLASSMATKNLSKVEKLNCTVYITEHCWFAIMMTKLTTLLTWLLPFSLNSKQRKQGVYCY